MAFRRLFSDPYDPYAYYSHIGPYCYQRQQQPTTFSRPFDDPFFAGHGFFPVSWDLDAKPEAMRVVREVEREAETLEYIVRQRGEELRVNQRARVAAGEVLMGMLLRLDAARGARKYRRRVTRKVLALQDAVDALEPKAPADEATAEDVIETKAAPATATEPEVGTEETGAAAAEATAAEEAEPASDGASTDDDKPDGSDAEWEMVMEESAAAPAAAACPKALRQEITSAADAGAGIVDTGKLMQMVAALCEQNAQLAERVDSLERTMRRMEHAEHRA